ncbi:hypothetical protein CAPTEDRAFT_188317 [Capitella teleta]|uniref:Farnesoic acid O-methyl transferase domain-containing protein n=1 Tax=Capitella teleta TaxID=283909 RepID=R7T7V9_CAPTE|nr:hypothetical protein CAPTEDRAFT_188317 [Capitella teleta]|eukprot:ELT89719.1 hypothetical protein CAPTEDRAFT_188317 [Capitella teleta]
MKIFLVLTLALFADFAMGDIDMCFMEKQTETLVFHNFTNHYPGSNHFYFGIKACEHNDLVIATTFETNMFMLYFKKGKIGAWKNNIRRWSTDQVMLNCNEMKYFWIEWSEGELSFGKGLELGNGTLYTFNDADVRPELNGGLKYFEFDGGAEFENQCISRYRWRMKNRI